MTKIKRDRTRKAGFRGSMNSQDFPRTVYTPAQKRHYLRQHARTFVAMIRIWGEGSLLEAETGRAVERLIGVLDLQIAKEE